MSRITMQSPAGDEYYPIRVERAHFHEGAAIVEGDPVYDLVTANGRSLRIRASHGGRAVSRPLEPGDVLSEPADLLEIEINPGRTPPVKTMAEPQALSSWREGEEDVWGSAKPPSPFSARKAALWLGGGVFILAVIAVAGWLALSYMPLASDAGDPEGYYGQRAGVQPLGGKRRLLTPDEQQERFEQWLDS